MLILCYNLQHVHETNAGNMLMVLIGQEGVRQYHYNVIVQYATTFQLEKLVEIKHL
jgi:hypothetical protein